VENAYADSYPHIASLCAITPQHRLWFGSAFASCCGWADGKKAVVPREGVGESVGAQGRDRTTDTAIFRLIFYKQNQHIRE